MLPIVEQFDPLPREQILAIRPGTWGDFELLDVLKYFETERKDRDRAMAVAELILRSPQVSDVDYGRLCLDLMGYYRWKRNTGDLSPAVLSEFRAALLPPLSNSPMRSAAQDTTPYLPPIAQLLAGGMFDETLPADGAPARAVALLRALRDTQAAELDELSAWLDQATGDWRNELPSANISSLLCARCSLARKPTRPAKKRLWGS